MPVHLRVDEDPPKVRVPSTSTDHDLVYPYELEIRCRHLLGTERVCSTLNNVQRFSSTLPPWKPKTYPLAKVPFRRGSHISSADGVCSERLNITNNVLLVKESHVEFP